MSKSQTPMFTPAQLDMLNTPPPPSAIKPRKGSHGETVYYLTGGYVIETANRIFGLGNWSVETISNECAWGPCVKAQEINGREKITAVVQYRATVRVTIVSEDGSRSITRQQSGVQQGEGTTAGEAVDIACKGAETDAMKRSLATLGPAFGIDLKSKDRAKAAHEGTLPPRRAIAPPPPDARPPMDIGFEPVADADRRPISQRAIEARRMSGATHPPELPTTVNGCPV